MNDLDVFLMFLNDYLEKFKTLSEKYDHTINNYLELESLIDEYSNFIVNTRNQEMWEKLQQQENCDLNQLIVSLREKSSRCVAIMEKYRALKLLSGVVEMTDYFKNIESCIAKEFGSFQITSNSKVLLVGSGSFPMTPLLIAKRTGAEVVGIDIDDEAIELGLGVVERLGTGLNIRLEKVSVENLDFTKDATHIICSSTVKEKYNILEQLHTLTNDNVVVAIRYGDQLKSLFNYPSKEVDKQKWNKIDDILRPDDVFDIELYRKV
ncbi:class I SAM-dependent methyltransferase [Bacillus cereus]|uniref:class I SAM-dependent methyltransferase n=1 Tax=Bacillus cereus group TaxID=86661 RepID=UPI0007B6F67A|nr:class I SAM-dependent methyltransferase [Bacillus cereus]MRC27544.1 methyltransferase domain-containing protein [Bacillus thuringiensis]ANC20096.1 ribosomal RNA methyltransferase FmrO domain protein [Bacillus cereus]MDA2478003.1 class I SAM-dependent methyltransferase [Bacillus cereus]MDA2495245.1 class I SAM-dependent methyltransferase [Bacillus cereus]UUN15369.1 methyltransferase domain-containing protein [Bacillus cereus]